MKIWLRNLYISGAEDHLEIADFEHIRALGSLNNEAAIMHELNADHHRIFAKELRHMANNIMYEICR